MQARDPQFLRDQIASNERSILALLDDAYEFPRGRQKEDRHHEVTRLQGVNASMAEELRRAVAVG